MVKAHKSDTFNLIPAFSRHANWPEVKKIIFTLNKYGNKAYLAGGCVRDAFLNRTPKDFDVATSARAEEILRLFPNSNKQGKAFGVVAVFCSKGPVEVATFRKDGPYTDGRHPEYVEFLSDKEDALRRDFTVNALFYDLKSDKVIDYVKGIEDIEKKIIRTVGAPKKRFQEDHLRILRAVRFRIQLGFKVEASTQDTLFEMKDTLLKISRERIYEECVKILKIGNFRKAGEVFKELSLLNYFLFPFFSNVQDSDGAGIKKNALLTNIESSPFLPEPSEKTNWSFCLNFWNWNVPDELLKEKSFLWMWLFYPILIQKERNVLNTEGKWKASFSENLKNWKFPVNLIRTMNNIFYSSCCLLGTRKASLGKKLRMLNEDFSKNLLFLCKNYLKNKKLNTHIIDKIEKEFIIRALGGKLPESLVNGNDLKSLGISENENMAVLLEHLYDIQLERKITEKAQLLSIVHSL